MARTTCGREKRKVNNLVLVVFNIILQCLVVVARLSFGLDRSYAESKKFCLEGW